MTFAGSLVSVRKPALGRALAVGLILVGVLAFTSAESAQAPSGAAVGGINPAAAGGSHVQLYFTVKAKKQGNFKGDGLGGKSHADQMLAFAFDYGIVSPRDLATGQASGKRQHKPVTVSKAWGPSMPQFLQAVATNELLTEVTFNFWDASATGVQRIHFVVKLTNATVSEVRQRLSNDLLTEDITFFFQRISIDDKVGGTFFTDDWSTIL